MDDKNINMKNQTSVDTSTLRMPEENLLKTNHSHMGVILGILIVLLVIILGGIYLWGGYLVSTPIETVPTPGIEPFNNTEPETPRAAADAQIFGTLSPSDELSAIEADIESTNLDSLGSELDTIDAEMDAALVGQ